MRLYIYGSNGGGEKFEEMDVLLDCDLLDYEA